MVQEKLEKELVAGLGGGGLELVSKGSEFVPSRPWAGPRSGWRCGRTVRRPLAACSDRSRRGLPPEMRSRRSHSEWLRRGSRDLLRARRKRLGHGAFPGPRLRGVEIEPAHTGANGRQQPSRRRGDKQEHRPRRRLLERLRSALAARDIELVRLVDDDGAVGALLGGAAQEGLEAADLVDGDRRWKALRLRS